MAFDLGTIFAEIGVNTAKLDQGLMSAQLKLGNFDKSISSVGQKLTANSTKMMVSGGLMAGSVIAVGVAAVSMAAKFETSMRNVNSISKLSESEFKALGESVVGISKKFPQTAKELADGLYDIASSGFSGAAGLKVLEASAMAASAGMTDTATSAKGITAVLNAFGLEADQAGAVADTMFRTVDRGVISFEELSSTVGDWVGMGKAAGLEFNELSGAIAYMTTKGINASEAGTSLQRMLTGIIKPSEEMAAMIKNAGFESGEMMLKTLGLTGSMKVLNDTTGGSISKLIELIPEIRGVRGANALLGSGYEELTKFMGGFVDTTGSAAIALKEQSKSLEYQLKLLKNSATAIGIVIGNRLIPEITKYVTAADGMTAANTELIASNIILAMKMGGAVSGILLAGAAYGKIALFVKGLTTALTPLATAAGVTVAGLSSIAVLVGSMANRLGGITAAFDTGAIATMGWNERLQEMVNILLLGIPEILNEIPKLFGAETKDFEFGYGAMLEKLWDNLRGIKPVIEETTSASATGWLKAATGMEAASAAMTGVTTEAEKNKAAIEAEAKSVDDMRGAYSELIGVLFDSINTSNAFQEAGWALKDAQDAVTEAVKQYGEGSREAETAINGLDAASQTYIDTAYAAYTAIDNTKEVQDAAKESAIKYGLKMVETGKWGEDAFVSMASQFGMSAGDIIAWADATDIKLDYATRMRIINLDTDGAMRSAQEYQQALDNLHADPIVITAVPDYRGIGLAMEAASRAARYGGSMGGMVTASGIQHFALGGTVGIPTAASGMVVPQTGRAIPILAHEYEDIVNTSQQRNLAEWIMGKANSRPDGKTTSNEVILHTIINLDGQVLWENNEKFDLRKAGERV